MAGGSSQAMQGALITHAGVLSFQRPPCHGVWSLNFPFILEDLCCANLPGPVGGAAALPMVCLSGAAEVLLRCC